MKKSTLVGLGLGIAGLLIAMGAIGAVHGLGIWEVLAIWLALVVFLSPLLLSGLAVAWLLRPTDRIGRGNQTAATAVPPCGVCALCGNPAVSSDDKFCRTCGASKEKVEEETRIQKEKVHSIVEDLSVHRDRLEMRLTKEVQKLAAELRIAQDDLNLTKFLDSFRETSVASYVARFLDITYSKVGVIDEYGDKNLGAIAKEIEKLGQKCLIQPCTGFWAPYLRRVFEAYQTLVDSQTQIRELDIEKLDGVEFEAWLIGVLKEMGYQDVTGTSQSGDQGADVIAHKKGKKIVIQAKKYTSAVGNSAVQEVFAAKEFYGGDESWVVTNSTFTPGAVALAHKCGVRLIDGGTLKREFGGGDQQRVSASRFINNLALRANVAERFRSARKDIDFLITRIEATARYPRDGIASAMDRIKQDVRTTMDRIDKLQNEE